VSNQQLRETTAHTTQSNSTEDSTQSVKRLRRAAAARLLLGLHESGQLAQPELWTWDALDSLPGWCLQDEQTRTRLQLLCGALVLAPELRLWIDRELILAAQQLISKPFFDQVVARAEQAPISINASVASRFATATSTNAKTESVNTVFMQAGASVLKASLSEQLPVDMLCEALGDTAGDIRWCKNKRCESRW